MYIVIEEGHCSLTHILGKYDTYDEAVEASAILEASGILTTIIKEEIK